MTTPRCTTRRRGLPAGRTLHLVDLENLAGEARFDPAALAGTIEAYRASVSFRPGDHVVVGCDRRLAVLAGAVWPGARLVVGSGPDGADHALLAAADPDELAARYDRVVI